MRSIEQVSADLFEKLKNNFRNISLGDKNAEATVDPEHAIFFNFDYVKKGKNLGNITISLMDNRLQIFYSKNITQALVADNKKEWYDFLKGLRMFAMRNMLEFDTRDISKDNLSLRDIKTLSSSYNDQYSTSDVRESKDYRMYGTTKSSYQQIGSSKLVVRHNSTVDEEKMGARGRNIRAMYIENRDGERFKVPNNNLLTGRVMARHLHNGGQINDDFAQHVYSMVQEMNDLRYFVRHNKNNTYEDTTTKEMIEAAISYYGALRETLRGLKSQRGYARYKESWKPDNSTYVDVDGKETESLKERFIQTSFNEKLEAALPHVAKVYQRKVQEQKHLEERVQSYVEGKKSFGLTEEERALFKMMQFEDAEALVTNVLGTIASKLRESDSILSNFANKASTQWESLNPAQKSLAVGISKRYVQEVKGPLNEVEKKTNESGKWNYPKNMTSKTNKSDDDYLGGHISKRKKEDRKEWRKKQKAKAHKELMKGQKLGGRAYMLKLVRMYKKAEEAEHDSYMSRGNQDSPGWYQHHGKKWTDLMKKIDREFFKHYSHLIPADQRKGFSLGRYNFKYPEDPQKFVDALMNESESIKGLETRPASYYERKAKEYWLLAAKAVGRGDNETGERMRAIGNKFNMHFRSLLKSESMIENNN